MERRKRLAERQNPSMVCMVGCGDAVSCVGGTNGHDDICVSEDKGGSERGRGQNKEEEESKREASKKNGQVECRWEE